MEENKIILNRKMLSEIAICEPAAFDAILAKAGLELVSAEK